MTEQANKMRLPESTKAIALLVALFTTLIAALVGWNLTITYHTMDISYETLKVAEEAKRLAATAAPNRYTSIDYEKDREIHNQQHIREAENCRRNSEQQLKLVSSELHRAIAQLEIPPPRVAMALESHSKQLSILETKLRQFEYHVLRETKEGVRRLEE